MSLKVKNKRMLPLNSNREEPFPLLQAVTDNAHSNQTEKKSVVLSITSLNKDQAKCHV